MNIQDIKNSTRDGPEIKELSLKKELNPINSEIPNENLAPHNLVNSFLLNNSLHINNISNSLSNSTCYESKLNIDSNSSIINELHSLYKFNSLRSNFYLKHKPYDIPLTDNTINFNNYNCPPKYAINDELFAFVYPNDLMTYSISMVGFLDNIKILNYDLSKNLEANDSLFFSLLGLYFCGNTEEITTENKLYIKKCLPDEFMCKKCMLINKRKYNLNIQI